METHTKNHSSVGFLVGQAISLYPLDPIHKDLYFQWTNSAKVRLYFGNSVPVSMGKIEEMWLKPSQENIFFEIRQNIENIPIGIAKITGIHWIRRKCSIGALIGDEKWRGTGYGRQVTRLLIDYIFGELNLNKIASIIYSPNIASIKVVESLNFKLEAKIGDAGYFDGEYCEDLYYALYQRDWKHSRQEKN